MAIQPSRTADVRFLGRCSQRVTSPGNGSSKGEVGRVRSSHRSPSRRVGRASTAEDRLRYYADQFPIVEVDAT